MLEQNIKVLFLFVLFLLFLCVCLKRMQPAVGKGSLTIHKRSPPSQRIVSRGLADIYVPLTQEGRGPVSSSTVRLAMLSLGSDKNKEGVQSSRELAWVPHYSWMLSEAHSSLRNS